MGGDGLVQEQRDLVARPSVDGVHDLIQIRDQDPELDARCVVVSEIGRPHWWDGEMWDGGMVAHYPTIFSSLFGFFMPFAQRSPTLASRAGTVSIVKSLGSRSGRTSSQVNGVDTVAPSFARTLYTPATVLPRMFCR